MIGGRLPGSFGELQGESKDIFISPYLDGPLKFNNTSEEDLKLDYITKYGRKFSIVRVPYAFKLLMQELQTMNIQMRIITENNIEQLTSMNYKNTIDVFKKVNINIETKDLKDLSPDEILESTAKKPLDKTIKNSNDGNNEDKEEDEESVYSDTDESMQAKLNRVRKEQMKKISEEELDNASDSDESVEEKKKISFVDNVSEKISKTIENSVNSIIEKITPTKEIETIKPETIKPETIKPETINSETNNIVTNLDKTMQGGSLNINTEFDSNEENILEESNESSELKVITL